MLEEHSDHARARVPAHQHGAGDRRVARGGELPGALAHAGYCPIGLLHCLMIMRALLLLLLLLVLLLLLLLRAVAVLTCERPQISQHGFIQGGHDTVLTNVQVCVRAR